MKFLLPITLALAPAHATSTGRTGGSTTGCRTCHGGSADSTTSASFSASAIEVAPGDTLSVTFQVATSSSSRSGAGFNVSATGGTLTAGSGSKIVGGELTHSSTATLSSGSVDFDFTWTAPSAAGTYTLRGVGNAVNRNGAASGDGWNLATDLDITVVCPDADADGFTTCDGDCDDADPAIHPGADETCDGVDEDCDGVVDDNPIDGTDYFSDDDGDGYGDPGGVLNRCSQPSGTVLNGDDCDDTDAAVNPAGTEVCGGTDEDCDGLTDDADPSVTGETDWYEDADGDGYGSTLVDSACVAPSGTVSVSGDCDDSDAATAPGAPESCTDPVDRNCDGSVGLVDADGDGFAACEECDDADAAVNPGATEQCNGVDDDCDSDIDEADAIDAVAWPLDADGDGFGHPEDVVISCEQPSGTTTGPTTDCDDDDSEVNPDAAEICNGIDDDCDAEVDGPGAVDAVPWPVDGDGDGFAHPEDSAVDCTPPDGTVTEREPVDCDDANADVNPGATELWYDAVDQDCDGQDDDQDGDGLGVAEDCDDTDPARGVSCADDDEPPGTEDSKGCSAAGATGGSVALLLVLGALARRREQEA